MRSTHVFDVMGPVSLASDPSRRRAKRYMFCATLALLLAVTSHGREAMAAGVKGASGKTDASITGVPHFDPRSSQLFAMALFGQTTLDGSSAELSSPKASAMALTATPTRELADVPAKVFQMQPQISRIQAKPLQLQVSPSQMQAKTYQRAPAVEAKRTQHASDATFGRFDTLRGPLLSGSVVEQNAAYGGAPEVDRQSTSKHLMVAAVSS